MHSLGDVQPGLSLHGSRRAEESLSPRSMTSRFALVIVIFVAIQAIILILSLVAIEGVNATRAYVAGEDAYAKAQKHAALDLRRYVVWGQQAYLDSFRREIAVPIGDRIGRDALEAQPPDFAKAYAGFVQGRNDPRDILSQSRLFVWFSWWLPFDRAIQDWRTGDRLVAELVGRADEIAAALAKGPFDSAQRDAFLAGINDIDDRLTRLEDDFSAHMGEAARAARDLAMFGLALGSVLLLTAGIGLAWRTFRIALRAEGRLAHSEQRFRDFAKVASDWFWETDAQNRVAYFSGGADHDGTGDAGSIIGKTLVELTRGEPAEESRCRHLEDVAARRPFRDFCYSYRRPDGGEQFWSLSGAPVYDHRGKFAGYRGTGSEITRDVLAQRSLQHAKEQAETASRAKSEFLANMSHELRTPLNAILGFAEIIRDRLLGPVADRYAEYAQDIYSSGTHLLGIINDILDLSKVEAGRLELVEEIVDIQSIVKSVVLLLRERVATAGLTLKVELPDALLLLRADERKLKQVLMNLLSNAVKFTPAGGEILIRVAVESERGVVIEVRDSGIGIAPGDIARALSPFGQVDSRLSRRYEGTGLGLPLARALAALHGGRLELESTPGQGTTARIVLPSDRLVEREMRRWIAG
ncbi:MAG TPA: ATP-binding protein [Stellaceae bacterium]|nr:ATP-binding protein [Stellaceae bacterium]